jgi:hypothetical protein
MCPPPLEAALRDPGTSGVPPAGEKYSPGLYHDYRLLAQNVWNLSQQGRSPLLFVPKRRLLDLCKKP